MAVSSLTPLIVTAGGAGVTRVSSRIEEMALSSTSRLAVALPSCPTLRSARQLRAAFLPRKRKHFQLTIADENVHVGYPVCKVEIDLSLARGACGPAFGRVF
jgi:hypothetical protein